MTKRKRRTFTPEQKAQALRLAEELGNVSQASRDLGMPPELIYRWRKQAEIDAGRGPSEALTTDEKKELTKLRREVKTLRMERDFLKKATAYFAKESDLPTK
ncbi:MAG: transposase [Planctomycetota bacterium]